MQLPGEPGIANLLRNIAGQLGLAAPNDGAEVAQHRDMGIIRFSRWSLGAELSMNLKKQGSFSHPTCERRRSWAACLSCDESNAAGCEGDGGAGVRTHGLPRSAGQARPARLRLCGSAPALTHLHTPPRIQLIPDSDHEKSRSIPSRQGEIYFCSLPHSTTVLVNESPDTDNHSLLQVSRRLLEKLDGKAVPEEAVARRDPAKEKRRASPLLASRTVSIPAQ